MNSTYTQQWKSIQNGLQHVSETVSLVINSLLICLIIFKSPSKLGPYKYLMIYISVFEILYSIVDFLVTPIFYSFGPALIVIVNLKESLFNRFFSYVFLSVFLVHQWRFLGIHFIYRYLVASGSVDITIKQLSFCFSHQLLATFSTWKITLWLSLPVLYGVIWGLGSYYACGPTDYTSEFVKMDVLANYGLQMEEIAYFGLHFYRKNGKGETFIVYEQVFGIIINIFLIDSSLFSAIYFGVKCYHKINDLASQISTRNKSLQSQLFYALVIQTLIPIVLMHIPVTIIYSFAFMGYGMGTICGIASITISMYPAFDPLPTIFIIKNYREAVLSELMGFHEILTEINFRFHSFLYETEYSTNGYYFRRNGKPEPKCSECIKSHLDVNYLNDISFSLHFFLFFFSYLLALASPIFSFS
ncbi:hypothetical protein CRE_11563 [Caenorhabditis remanei]|uniref:Seven TM Receptor n=1 Tax=Caenorhabditis remanei TaxID=31234 RepID=E3NNK4_CAERE|nr:hypothetical protein CRE_11563 [Caenorhabditis remanei]